MAALSVVFTMQAHCKKMFAAVLITNIAAGTLKKVSQRITTAAGLPVKLQARVNIDAPDSHRVEVFDPLTFSAVESGVTQTQAPRANVPEPASLMLLGVGLLGAVVLGRRGRASRTEVHDE